MDVDNSRAHVVPRFLCGLMGRGLAQDVPFGDGVAFLVFVYDLGVEPSLGCQEVLELFKLPGIRNSSDNHMRGFGHLVRSAWDAKIIGSTFPEVQGLFVPFCFMKAAVEVLVCGDVLVAWEPLHGFSGRGLLDDVEENTIGFRR